MFTGAGGLDLGLTRAGFNTLACIENDAIARATISANRPDHKLFTPGDISHVARTVSPSDLGLYVGELEILAGGPPCQPYSKAALWSPRGVRGLQDPRSHCLYDFLKLVLTFLPKVMLIENVPGFARGRNSAVPSIERALATINRKSRTRYKLDYRIVNALDFGVPQRRERVILVAFRDGRRFKWPKPRPRETVRAWDAIGHLSGSNRELQLSGQWAELLPSIPEGHNYLWHSRQGGGRPLFGYRTRYWSFLLKLAKAAPSWTLPAQPGPATGPFHWENRRLSTAEMLRLQTFPATWRVHGTYWDRVRQIGNATPPLLAEVLGRAIGEQLLGAVYHGRPTLSIPRRRVVPPPEHTLPVPRSYRAYEGRHRDHPGTGKGPRPTSKVIARGH